MEARSLTSLNYLAANPPQYPTNPTEEKQEPLVLYISRVPGTRDIILSPFKPQLKNVTAEDVASSLYYIHLDTRAQETILYRHSEDDAQFSRNIPRKPIPRTERSESPPNESMQVPIAKAQRRSAPPQLPSPKPFEDFRADFFDAAQDQDQDQIEGTPKPPTQFPARKPLGPRALPNLPEQYAPTPNNEKFLPSVKQSFIESGTGQRKSVPPAPTSQPPPPPDAPSQDTRPATRSSRSPSPRKWAGSFHLNLIRRDPATGTQWNVGMVGSSHHEPSPAGPLLAPDSISPSARPPIDISIETSGYARFRGKPAPIGLDITDLSTEDMRNLANDNSATAFNRQVIMGYTKSLTSQLKDKLNKLELGRGQQGFHNRSQSTETGVPPTDTNSTQPGPGMKPRGYVFDSPWNGKCEFRTGNAGRSVRLHHTIHDTPQTAYNPLVADQPQQVPQLSLSTPFSAPSSVVSELRFNLPSSEILGPPSEDTDRATKLGNLAKFWKRDNEDFDDDDDEVSPFDMNLGREKAGGGNRGKRAKMGKLIVFHDGIKMLDLVVAANVGLWWGAWEKNF